MTLIHDMDIGQAYWKGKKSWCFFYESKDTLEGFSMARLKPIHDIYHTAEMPSV